MDRVAQIEKGYDDGREEGCKERLEEERRAFVRNLLKSGMDREAVAAATGLLLADIERLSRSE